MKIIGDEHSYRFEREVRARKHLRQRVVLVAGSDRRVEWLRTLLASAQCTVVRANNCFDCANKLRAEPVIDAVVLDVLVDDQGCARRVRAAHQHAGVVLLGSSPRSAARHLEEFSELGEVLLLDPPSAEYETLEVVAAAVRRTDRARQGLLPGESTGRFDPPSPSVLPLPQTDVWSGDTLRERINSVHQVVRLTDREAQVMRGLARRMTNVEIALQLGVSVHMVKKVAHALFAKLKLESRVEVAWLLEGMGEAV